ncbi:MAG TPA: 3'(2'),5'-bisphosphate nucleotidase CysQ [Polyangiaceae bacterium]|nr:3'(2'),5'-bisphosphate nucleotidase CysQ [Polyangiaceae bacterium]
MSELLDNLVAISFEAAALINEVYATPFTVDLKGTNDPVTSADLRANELICKRLGELYPGIPVVAEESAPERFSAYRTAERVFFVDPLDGTTEFVARNGQFVVMIGIVEDQRATVGVVTAPSQNIAWAGEVGGAAYSVDQNGVRGKIQVSNVTELGDAAFVASRSHRSPALERALTLLGGREMRNVGSAGLKGAEVASGVAEGYVAPGRVGKRWDACAVDALVTAAGGRFSDQDGRPYDYRTENLTNVNGLVATNGHIHDAVLDRLARLSH